VPELSRLGPQHGRRADHGQGATRTAASPCTLLKGAFVLGDDMNSKILSTALGLAAEIERELLQQRVKEGLARGKAAPASTSGGPVAREEDRRSSSTSTSQDQGVPARGVNKSNLAPHFPM